MPNFNLKTIWKFPTSQAQRELFKTGVLVRQWAERYPNIFDAQDVETALNQPDYHFYEWLAAVMFWHSIGYLSLVEKYQFNRHNKQQEILKSFVPLPLYDLITDHVKEYGSTQAPDLFLYAPDLSDWFFCEVKGPRDHMRASQNKFFEAISLLAQKPIYMVKFVDRR